MDDKTRNTSRYVTWAAALTAVTLAGCGSSDAGIDTTKTTSALGSVTATTPTPTNEAAPPKSATPHIDAPPSAAPEPVEPTARNTGPSSLAREVLPVQKLPVPSMPPPATKNPPQVSPEQEVILTAYRRYLKARTFTRLSPLDAEEIMSPYAAGAALENVVNRRFSATRDRRRYFGGKIHRPVPPEIKGTSAVVVDCRDQSSYREVDSYGNEDTTDSDFLADLVEFTVTLTVIDGVWKVVSDGLTDYNGKACKAIQKNGWYR